MARWTYLGGFGHKEFATETTEDMTKAIAELEVWMNQRATSVLVRFAGQAEAGPATVEALRAVDPTTVEEVFVIPQMSGGRDVRSD